MTTTDLFKILHLKLPGSVQTCALGDPPPLRRFKPIQLKPPGSSQICSLGDPSPLDLFKDVPLEPFWPIQTCSLGERQPPLHIYSNLFTYSPYIYGKWAIGLLGNAFL